MKNEKQESALDVLIDKLIYAIDSKIENLKFDKTFKATIWGITEDKKYEINYLGQKYAIPNALGTNLKIGQTVWVKIPSGIFKNMHICGVYK